MRESAPCCRCRSPLWAASRCWFRAPTLRKAVKAGIDAGRKLEDLQASIKLPEAVRPWVGEALTDCRIEPAKTSYHGGVRKKTVVLWIAAVMALSAFSVQAAPLARLRVSENGRFFVKADGSPFFWMGDTEWALFHLSREDAELYLKDRAAKKFTVIQAIATYWGGLDRPNAYGETVFVNGDPTHPNEAYFKHVDWVVDKAESLGLYIGMVPIWSKEYVQQDRSLLDKPSYGPTIRSAIRPDKPSVLDKTSAFGYGKFLGSRYRDKPIVWILGGDWFADGVEDIWRSLAAGLAAGDGGTHLKTYHPKIAPQLIAVVPQRRLAGLQHASNRPHAAEPELRLDRGGLEPDSREAGGGWRGRLRGL